MFSSMSKEHASYIFILLNADFVELSLISSSTPGGKTLV